MMGEIVKRLIDISLALMGLLISAPFLVICIIAIRSGSEGPALFRQTRIGFKERPFACLKLRTMYVGTASLPTHLMDGRAVTPLGVWLRKLKLDELPQLWNVLKGEMSFVGPRPCLPSQTELILARRKLGLFAIRPGITGISQIAGIDMSNPELLATSDSGYLQNMSLSRDFQMMWKTFLGGGRGDHVSPPGP